MKYSSTDSGQIVTSLPLFMAHSLSTNSSKRHYYLDLSKIVLDKLQYAAGVLTPVPTIWNQHTRTYYLYYMSLAQTATLLLARPLPLPLLFYLSRKLNVSSYSSSTTQHNTSLEHSSVVPQRDGGLITHYDYSQRRSCSRSLSPPTTLSGR